ncbi:MAG: glycosyltransferase family 1 protein [Nakamurella sp.]
MNQSLERARVLLDGTPLLGNRAGIGRYTDQLIAELASRPDLDVRATAFSLGAAKALRAQLPAGVQSRVPPIPARILEPAWQHLRYPPVEWLAARADLFHATNFLLPPIGRMPAVVTIHDLAFVTHPETVNPAARDLAALVPRTLARADAVCTDSEVIRARIESHFNVPPEQLFVAPIAVDTSWAAASPADTAMRSRLGLPESYLIFVGTREPRKDLPTLISAYRRLRSQLAAEAPALLLVGSPGWGDDPAAEPVEGMIVADYLPQQDMPAVVAGAKALVMPSLDEGFGMPAVEGLAAGIPVVVSDIPTLQEVTGGAAITFAVGNTEALTAALATALAGGGPDRPTRTAQAARFTAARMADRTVDAYRYALDRRGIRTALHRD